jgi:hypothetical protein
MPALRTSKIPKAKHMILLIPSGSAGTRGIDSEKRRKKRKLVNELPFSKFGAGEESRTLDLYLGKVSLYQLSYSRIER